MPSEHPRPPVFLLQFVLIRLQRSKPGTTYCWQGTQSTRRLIIRVSVRLGVVPFSLRIAPESRVRLQNYFRRAQYLAETEEIDPTRTSRKAFLSRATWRRPLGRLACMLSSR